MGLDTSVFRQCAITKKMLPRTELFRIVRTKDGNVYFDANYSITGRGIHFSREEKVVEQFFNPKKRKMVNYFLKAEVSEERFQELKKI